MDIRANYLYMCASGNVCKMVCAQLGRAQKICAQKFVRKWVQPTYFMVAYFKMMRSLERIIL